MEFKFNDGGRYKAGFKNTASDCVVRAISIITDLPYKEVYDAINIIAKDERITKRRKSRSTSNGGVYKVTYSKYLETLGFKWIPTMFVGVGCKVHLKKEELPKGKLIVRLSKHLTSVIDGVIHDTYDPSRGETRCVYGYWVREEYVTL